VSPSTSGCIVVPRASGCWCLLLLLLLVVVVVVVHLLGSKQVVWLLALSRSRVGMWQLPEPPARRGWCSCHVADDDEDDRYKRNPSR
jgi:hypothetical protein